MKVAPRLGGIEEIKALVEHGPKLGKSGGRDTAGDADRVVAAEPRHIDVRVGPERRQVALIVEAPDRPGMAVLEFGAADDHPVVGEIGDRIDAVECEAGVPVDHDAFGGGGTQNRRKPRGHHGQAEGDRAPDRAGVPLS